MGVPPPLNGNQKKPEKNPPPRPRPEPGHRVDHPTPGRPPQPRCTVTLAPQTPPIPRRLPASPPPTDGHSADSLPAWGETTGAPFPQPSSQSHWLAPFPLTPVAS